MCIYLSNYDGITITENFPSEGNNHCKEAGCNKLPKLKSET